MDTRANPYTIGAWCAAPRGHHELKYVSVPARRELAHWIRELKFLIAWPDQLTRVYGERVRDALCG